MSASESPKFRVQKTMTFAELNPKGIPRTVVCSVFADSFEQASAMLFQEEERISGLIAEKSREEKIKQTREVIERETERLRTLEEGGPKALTLARGDDDEIPSDGDEPEPEFESDGEDRDDDD